MARGPETRLEAKGVLAKIAQNGTEDSLKKLKEWMEQAQKPRYKAFTKRLLGAARYKELARAIRADAALLALVARRLIRASMIFAVAWDDALGVMTKEQMAQTSKLDALGPNAAILVIGLDGFLGEKLLSGLSVDLPNMKEEDLAEWRPEDSALLASQFRALISEASANRVERENSPLVRKIRGARDALKHSEDGVSQAANSLIELVDRLMRDAFSQDEVMAWIDANLPDEAGLFYLDDRQQRRATKRGEALCLIYGGGPVLRAAIEHDDGKGPSLVHDALARVIIVVRSKLQRLKHADGGSAEEREQLMVIMGALEASLMLGLPLGRWSGRVDAAEQAGG